MAPRQQQYSQEDLTRAVSAAQFGYLSVREASTLFSVPKSTIQDKIKGSVVVKKRVGPKTELTQDEELGLVAWIELCQRRGFPRPDQALLHEVQKIIEEDGRENRFVNNKPGKKWLKLFLQRHPHSNLMIISLTMRHMSYK